MLPIYTAMMPMTVIMIPAMNHMETNNVTQPLTGVSLTMVLMTSPRAAIMARRVMTTPK